MTATRPFFTQCRWQFHRLTNGGFYCEPIGASAYAALNDGGMLSTTGAGILVTLVMLADFTRNHVGINVMPRAYRALLYFARQSDEWPVIDAIL